MTDRRLKQPGRLFIFSGPSGAGKTTLRRAVLAQFTDLIYSVSYTTREPRTGEKNGVDYHFITKKEFEEGFAHDRWAEWAEVHGHYYGTSAEFIDDQRTAGRDVLLDIDVQGTRKILERYPEVITIFIAPPSLEVLRRRLEDRGTDRQEVIALRLKNAEKEMAQKGLYRHLVINDRLSDAVTRLASIIQNTRKSGPPAAGNLQRSFSET
jgi:guanylate kinase